MANDKTFKEYVDYFEGIATNCAAIGHTTGKPRFFRTNIKEVMGKLRSGIDLETQILVLEAYDGFLDYDQSDQYFLRRDGAFWILQKHTREDYDAEHVAYSDTEQTALDIISRIRRDARTYPAQNRMPTMIDHENFKWLKVDQVFEESLCGWRVSFSMSQIQSLAYEGSKWLD